MVLQMVRPWKLDSGIFDVRRRIDGPRRESGVPQLPFSASSSSLMKRLRRSRMVSSSGCAAILRACARGRSSPCRLVVFVSVRSDGANATSIFTLTGQGNS